MYFEGRAPASRPPGVRVTNYGQRCFAPKAYWCAISTMGMRLLNSGNETRRHLFGRMRCDEAAAERLQPRMKSTNQPNPAEAFGAPGMEPRWTHGGKDGVGTAYAASSLVWFTFWNGAVTEVYYPTVDRPQLHEMEPLWVMAESTKAVVLAIFGFAPDPNAAVMTPPVTVTDFT